MLCLCIASLVGYLLVVSASAGALTGMLRVVRHPFFFGLPLRFRGAVISFCGGGGGLLRFLRASTPILWFNSCKKSCAFLVGLAAFAISSTRSAT